MRTNPVEVLEITFGFLLPFGCLAFASRVILFTLGDWASLAVGLPVRVARNRTPSGFHVSHV
jgi:hypothetical protein